MLNFLAIDAGGTSTRAVLVRPSGQCLSYGTSGGGNPVSRGFDGAISSLVEAALGALDGSAQPFHSVVMGMAGASLELPIDLFHQHFAPLGLSHEIVIESDLLAAFYSGTHHDNGYALIAGTGAVAARVSEGQLASVTDGTGWLLGDNGSGFWLGREVVRAVAAALDGRGAPTALTHLVLADLEISEDSGQRTQGRLNAQQQLIVKTYAQKPIELSRFAPLVFAVKDDAVAELIIDRCAAALAQTLTAVIDPKSPGPLVFGGSVLTKGATVAAAVLAQLARQEETDGFPAFGTQSVFGVQPTPILVQDGMVGAAVLALKRHNVTVDQTVFDRITSSLAQLRG